MPPPEQRSQTVSLLCGRRFFAGGISEGEKSQCHAVRRHFSQTKICVSTFCQGARGRRSELLASFSEDSQSLMGLLFHSICRLTSYGPQLHTCEQATVTLHTYLQTASSALPLTADRSCWSSDAHKKNQTDVTCEDDYTMLNPGNESAEVRDVSANSSPSSLSESIILTSPGAAAVMLALIGRTRRPLA